MQLIEWKLVIILKGNVLQIRVNCNIITCVFMFLQFEALVFNFRKIDTRTSRNSQLDTSVNLSLRNKSDEDYHFVVSINKNKITTEAPPQRAAGKNKKQKMSSSSSH